MSTRSLLVRSAVLPLLDAIVPPGEARHLTSINLLATRGEPSFYVKLRFETTTTWLGSEPLPMAAHKFKVRQLVTLHLKRHAVFAEQFEVVRLLPPANADFQYRVKSTRDGHERVVFESELSASLTR
jgi:hypothetical protein